MYCSNSCVKLDKHLIYFDHFQMNTTYLLQGERMRLMFNGFTIPVAGLNLFNTLIILILVPFVDRFLYQYLARKGYPLSQLKRIGK